jgi:hypothetical protein
LATRRASVWPYVAALAPLVVLFAIIEIFNATRYGTLNPAPGNAMLGDGLFQVAPQVGLGHLMFDSKYGLLPHFPLFVLAVPGIILALRRTMMFANVVLLATVVPYVAAISTFGQWWAGLAPPARFLAVVAPVLAYYVAVATQRVNHWLVTALAAVASLVTFGRFVASDINPSERFYAWPDSGQQASFAIWTVGLVGFTVAIWLAGRRSAAVETAAVDTAADPAAHPATDPAAVPPADPAADTAATPA